MANAAQKRAWKLQEFVAHGGHVNCLALGKKSGRVIVSGGEDKKVNVWAVGKPNCIMSLSGHTSPVECVRFGPSEEMIVAGSMSGALKIWNLEQAKIVRTLTGHKSSIRSLDFHPYGDFVASGSLDTNIKLWDIRRKGCIFTYKGHANCVNALRFSPDGRWIASGGADHVIKIWDLTAGKLLTDLALHSGPINTLEFHPGECLLASGSADRTVKFWDLETFQLISSTDGDVQPVRSVFFHPEGTCLYAGANNSLKVYGWEPARCHDTLSLDWGQVADIASAQNQLIGASYAQTNVSTFVVDMQKVVPCGGTPTSTPTTHQALPTSGRKSFCLERPPTHCSRPESVMKESGEEPSAPSPGESEDDAYNVADIQNPEDYQQIFQPRNRHLPRGNDDGNSGPFTSNSKSGAPAPAPPATCRSQHATPFTKPTSISTKATPTSTPASTPASVHRLPPPPPVEPPPPRPSPVQPPPTAPPVFHPPPPPVVHQPYVQPKQPLVSPQMPDPTDQMAALNIADFLPKSRLPQLDGVRPAMSESEVLAAIIKGHASMVAVMTSRCRNLQVVRGLWMSGNTKTALDSALSMHDQAIMVDIMQILVQKPSLWSLDLASLLLPAVRDMLASKYENYALCGCQALKVILRSFAALIKANISAPPSAGVDISREERFRKCRVAYSTLVEIRQLLATERVQGKIGPHHREVALLMAALD